MWFPTDKTWLNSVLACSLDLWLKCLWGSGGRFWPRLAMWAWLLVVVEEIIMIMIRMLIIVIYVCCLMSTYSVLDTVLSAFHMLSRCILKTTLMIQGTLFIPLYRWEHWNSERWSYLPEVTQGQRWNLRSDLSDVKTHILKYLYCTASHVISVRLSLFNLFNC